MSTHQQTHWCTLLYQWFLAVPLIDSCLLPCVKKCVSIIWRERRLQASKYGRKQCIFQTLKLSLQMFYEESSAFSTFVRPQGYTQCVLLRNTEWYIMCVFVRKLHRVLLRNGCQFSYFLCSLFLSEWPLYKCDGSRPCVPWRRRMPFDCALQHSSPPLHPLLHYCSLVVQQL